MTDTLTPEQARREADMGDRFTPIGDLLREPDDVTEYLVHGLLPAGGLSLILGKPKAGKSTLARNLCAAVARGDEWVGRPCSMGPALYVALEEKRAEVRRHFAALAVEEDAPIYVYCDRVPVEAKPADWLRPAMERYRPALVVIDPLGRFVRMRDNDYEDATSKLEPLITLARESTPKSHIAFVHHARKSAGEHGDESLGSTAILGSVDTAVILRRERSGRMVYSVNRYGEDLAETIATLDEATGRVVLGLTKAEAGRRTIEDAILDHVAASEEPVKHAEVVKEVTGKAASIVNAIHGLVDSGRLIRQGAATRKDPYRYSIPIPHLYRGGTGTESSGDAYRRAKDGE